MFFDEFEILGKERGDTRETGEIKRVVGTLLTQIDRLPDYVVAISASNHPELLDRAAWRRFQVRILLPSPSKAQITLFVDNFAANRKFNFGLATSTIADGLGGHSYGEVEEFCVDVLRQPILQGQMDRTLTQSKLKQWRERAAVRKRSEAPVANLSTGKGDTRGCHSGGRVRWVLTEGTQRNAPMCLGSIAQSKLVITNVPGIPRL